jgi:hypothetical protein
MGGRRRSGGTGGSCKVLVLLGFWGGLRRRGSHLRFP